MSSTCDLWCSRTDEGSARSGNCDSNVDGAFPSPIRSPLDSANAVASPLLANCSASSPRSAFSRARKSCSPEPAVSLTSVCAAAVVSGLRPCCLILYIYLRNRSHPVMGNGPPLWLVYSCGQCNLLVWNRRRRAVARCRCHTRPLLRLRSTGTSLGCIRHVSILWVA